MVHPVAIVDDRAVDLVEESALDGGPVQTVPIARLEVADSPRLDGVDLEHVQALAESGAELPPILVYRPTMQVIDGAHRLRAAALRGERDIAVRYFSGDQRDAFILAVNANIRHGLPLSLSDRVAAAARIMRSHPQWSDRAIADVTRLSHQTVGDIRRRATGDFDQLHASVRIGRDGRVRPLNSASARRLAGQLMAQDPGASLRQIAKAVGISPGTVRNVRDRLRRGEDPVPTRQRRDPARKRRREERQPALLAGVSRLPQPPAAEDVATTLRTLRRDPSLRFSEAGRALLRLLDGYQVVTEEADRLVRTVPPHCTERVADVAYACAVAWRQLAEKIVSARPPGTVG